MFPYRCAIVLNMWYIFSFNHRPFAGAERQEASHWNNRPDKLPWLQDPTTEYKLQCREPAAQSLGASGLHPTEAQIATLPHYCDPLLKLGRSENQVVYGNPSNAKDFYFEEPNIVRKPMAQHLERSFINWYLFLLRNLVFLVVFWHFCYFLALSAIFLINKMHLF